MRLLQRGLAALCALAALALAAPAMAACPPLTTGIAASELAVLKEICKQGEGGTALKSGAVQLGSGVQFNAIVTDAGAFAAGDALSDLITVTGAARTAGGSGTLLSLDFGSAGGLTTTVHFYAWSKLPSATCTKNAAFAPSAADNAYKLPGFPMSGTLAGNGLSVDTRTRIMLSGLAATYVNQDTTPGTAIYICAVSAGTPTPGTTGDFSLVLGALRD